MLVRRREGSHAQSGGVDSSSPRREKQVTTRADQQRDARTAKFSMPQGLSRVYTHQVGQDSEPAVPPVLCGEP